jgi:hypothetical protein
MNKLMALAALIAPLSVNAITEFQSGGVITASDMNGNFKALADENTVISLELNTLKETINNASNLPSGVNLLSESVIELGDTVEALDAEHEEISTRLNALEAFDFLTHVKPNALANGVPVYVQSLISGHYTLAFGNGSWLSIDQDGNPFDDSSFYYASEDCTGNPYIERSRLDEKQPINEEWLNPNVSNVYPQNRYDGESHYLGLSLDLYLLHARSRGNTTSCSSVSEDMVVSAPLPYDLPFEFPIHITGIGVPMKIIGEIGDAL